MNRKQRELADSWSALCKKWEETPTFLRDTPPKAKAVASTSGRRKAAQAASQDSELGNYLAKLRTARDTRGAEDMPSKATTGNAWLTKPEPMKYTGTKVLGVATMHKSSMVPIFAVEEAQDIAKMRR